MYADEAVLIPLKRTSNDSAYGGKEGAYIISNEGAQALFEVAGLPIYGSINSYGALAEIEKNRVTELMEAYYQVPVEAIADMASNSWRKDTKQDPQKPALPLTGCYVNRKIYEAMTRVENTFDEWGGTFNACEHADLPPEVLALCGFERAGECPERERFKFKYVNPEVPEIVVWADDRRWVKVEVSGVAWLKSGVYSAANLNQLARDLFGKTIYDRQKMQELSSYAVEYDVELAKYNRFRTLTSALKPETRSSFMDLGCGLTLGGRYRENAFIKTYGEHLEDPQVRDEYVRFKHFNLNMFSCNRLFMPTMNGWQHGNRHAEVKLHELSLDILRAELAEEEEAREN